MQDVLVDAGPLIALFNRADPDHGTCVKALSSLRERVVTVWPALTEASHFLIARSVGPEDLFGLIEAGDLGILHLSKDEVPRMRELMRRYADLPMDLADAALVAVAERERIETVFTLDRRDFSIYRPRHVKQFKLLP